jgi:hypothetical protein
MRHHDSTTYELTITRHATARFCLRSRTPDHRGAARLLTNAIENAVQEETLLHCARNLYAIPLDDRLVALCAVTGPRQKPISIALITVLTTLMAITSFRHLARVMQPSLLASDSAC